jgi:hypothetical protein
MTPILIAAAASAAIAGYDWIGLSITSDRFSQEMSQRYFHSEQECRLDTSLVGDRHDRVCFPVPTLPEEVWDRQNEIDARKAKRNSDGK